MRKLLDQNALPSSDIDTVQWHHLVGVTMQGQLVAAAGLEQCGDHLLLRSVVVTRDHRGCGIGERLVQWLHDVAQGDAAGSIWLLTNDAQRYFGQRFGYQAVDRNRAPEDIRTSSQFSALCPDSATLMRARIPTHTPTATHERT